MTSLAGENGILIAELWLSDTLYRISHLASVRLTLVVTRVKIRVRLRIYSANPQQYTGFGKASVKEAIARGLVF